MTGTSATRLRAVTLSVVLATSLFAAANLGFVGVAAAANAPDCATVSYSGAGNAADPYQVGTVDQLQCVEKQGLDGDYELTGDIDASETAEWNDGDGFDPIGGEFTGTFDGDNHTISGLTIDRGGTNDVGLFSVVGPAGTIRNVGLEGGSVTGGERVGQLVGRNGGTVEDSHATGEVIGSYRAGGLVGQNDGTVRRAYASGERSRANDWVGGLVGYNRGTVNHSFAARAVVGEGGGFDGTSAGGLVGVSTGTIADSYATGTVTASWFVGGLVGSYQADDGGTTLRSYATGALSIDDETQGIGGLVAGTAVSDTTVEQAYWDVGTTNEASATGDDSIAVTEVSGFGATTDTAPAPEMQGESAETNMPGLDFTTTWETVESDDPDAAKDGYPILRALDRTVQLRAQGITTETAPTAADCASLSWSTREIDGETYYEVDSLYKLQCVENRGLGNNYVLTEDIDASETAEWNDGDGFDPIGDFDTTLTGTFDGDTHAISGLTIDRPGTSPVGLFGAVGSDGTVTNVQLDGGTVAGGGAVGAVAGKNEGTVSGATVTTDVTGNGRNVGGVVGFNQGTIKRSGTTGDVSNPTAVNVGGVAGTNIGTVRESYATGDVTGSTGSYAYAGGLVGGEGGGTVVDSYATGNVTAGGRIVGGLVAATSSGTVRRSYATGAVGGTDGTVGGLLGESSSSATVENAYWDRGTTDQGTAIGAAFGATNGLVGFGSTGDSAPAANATGDTVYDTMPGLDFDSTWTATSSYPRLQWEGVDALTVDSLDATAPTVGENESGTITVAATDSEDSPAEGVSIEVINADGLAGLSGEAVTDASGQATFSFTGDTTGDYAPAFAWKYDDEVGETVTISSAVTVVDPPEVDAITRAGTSPTSADSIDFDVTFSESVTGVGTGDFTVTQASGDVTGAVSGVSGSGSSYTVTVDAITGGGDLRLDLVDDDGITAADSGVSLGGVGTSGESDGSVNGDSYTIDNEAPIADAGTDRTVADSRPVAFDASGSSGDIAAYEWDVDGDGTTEATGIAPSYTFRAPGTYDVALTVTDPAGNTDTDTLTVTVTDLTGPTADASNSDTAGEEDTAFTLDGTASTDNVDVTAYEWDVDGDGSYDATGANVTHTYADPGTYTAVLRVTDEADNTATDTVSISVADTTNPTADAGPNQTVDEDIPVALDAGNSTDNGRIASYAWDIEGNSTTDVTGRNVTHTYADPGTDTVTLTVTDTSGNTDTDTLTVTVENTGGGGGGGAPSSPADAPTAETDTYRLSPGSSLDASASTGVLGNDVLAEELRFYSVSVVEGPANGSLDLQPDGSFAYTPTDGFTGTDAFTYEVTHGGQTDRATVTLTVSSAASVERTVFESASAIRQAVDLPADATPTYAERLTVRTNQSGPVTVRFSENATVSSLRVGPETELRGTVTVTEFAGSDSVPSGVPGQPLAALQLTGSPSMTNATVTARMRLSRADLRASGTDAGAVRVAHYVDGSWEVLETSVVNRTGERVTVEAVTSGFSPFALTAVESPQATGSETPSTDTAGGSTAGGSGGRTPTATGAGGPGFGPVVAIMAILAVALVARLRR
ncbi:PKD domain-containing protein [Haloarcula sp. S1CR25-12]|uniref:PKD domain-containing protein n=1 Tax=Haloarcula saliterrae TaxID=2950534 RepID=A0ABU2FCN7_9EURY|nr:PKD domain-containing protein [Haloarcula sp. S1CR25-12]MDS0260006.1 PKD domain-containing protein [Haloarcula sp. S1CR25-12]